MFYAVLEKVSIVCHCRSPHGEEKSALTYYRWVPSTHFKGDSKPAKTAIQVLASKVMVLLSYYMKILVCCEARLMYVSQAVLARFMHQVMLYDVRNQEAR